MTGQPVWEIEDRPVPPATMPGDTAAPTQPFPTKPAPFEYQGVTEDDLADFTPEIRQMALDVIEDYRIGPLYTPPSLPEPGGKRGTIFRPSAGGGANWYGAAVDPETGWLYVPSLGGDTYTGPLLTKTLLIHGQHAPDDDGGNRLVARDKRTGDVIAEVPLPARGLGTPMTYLWEGRQYIALTIAGRRETDGVPELVAFALP